MRTDQLRAAYVHLTAHERFRLLVAATLRHDDVEVYALETSPRPGSVTGHDPAYALHKRAVLAVVLDYTRVAGPYLSRLQLLESLRPMIRATWKVLVNHEKVPKGANYGDLIAAVKAEPKQEFPFIAMTVAMEMSAATLASLNAGLARVCDERIGVDADDLLALHVPDFAEMLAVFSDEIAQSAIDDELVGQFHAAMERRFLAGGY